MVNKGRQCFLVGTSMYLQVPLVMQIVQNQTLGFTRQVIQSTISLSVFAYQIMAIIFFLLLHLQDSLVHDARQYKYNEGHLRLNIATFFPFSGESGAGKTESTKLLLRQLMELCRANSQLEQQILQVSDSATLI